MRVAKTNIKKLIDQLGSETLTIDGKEYPVNEANVARYAANKRNSENEILAYRRKAKGIVVKEVKEPVKEVKK